MGLFSKLLERNRAIRALIEGQRRSAKVDEQLLAGQKKILERISRRNGGESLDKALNQGLAAANKNSRSISPEVAGLATILIPTFERPAGLRRHLAFLAAEGNPFSVLILDGSSAATAEINRSVCQEFGSNVRHEATGIRHLPLRLRSGIDLVKTKYACLWGDDDLVVPSGIAESVLFLESDATYAACGGRVFHWYWKAEDLGFNYFDNSLATPCDVARNSLVERFLAFQERSRHSCPLWCMVKRTSTMQNAFHRFTEDMYYTEMEILGHVSNLSEGNVCSLNSVFGFRDYTSPTTQEAERQVPKVYLDSERVSRFEPLVHELVRQHEGIQDAAVLSYVAKLVLHQITPFKRTVFPLPAYWELFHQLALNYKDRFSDVYAALYEIPTSILESIRKSREAVAASSSPQP
ncbi:hypothetical protein AYO49_02995 [Verrucomicrobiaceae bacterium SCGC AG-212-N21]|nr:hypothetical protein AYO49_02995 [Verrucomicrobiaceae bacterium SCGC AG-212-N21]